MNALFRTLLVVWAVALLENCGVTGAVPLVSTFVASPSTLKVGGEVTLSWKARDATSLTLEPGGYTVSGDALILKVWQNTTFTLIARNAVGTTLARTSVTFVVPQFSSSVDPSVQPRQRAVGDSEVAALVDADGLQSDFVLDEVRFAPKDDAELQAFLARTHGTVIADDAVPEPPKSLGVVLTAAQRKATEYRVHLDGLVGDAATLNLEAPELGIGGATRFSSERAQRFFAAVTHEAVAGVRVLPNFLAYPHTVPFATAEAPLTKGGNLDAFDATAFPTFANTGSRASVVQAWQWLAGLGLTRRPRVAIIDSGFWLNPDGSPMVSGVLGSDFVGTPAQWDFVGRDLVADGPNAGSCAGSSCPWHGNSSAGVAVGAVNNSGGAAGTGGTIADPILFRIDMTAYEIHSAVKSAIGWGADVVNMSFGSVCNWSCRQYDRDDDAFSEAANAGVVLIASAGNDGIDVSTEYVHPCINDGVICVGAISDGSNRQFTSAAWSSNYGAQVDLWAPTNIRNMANGTQATVGTFSGTSASAPFVAGVAAMVKAINPGLSSEEMRVLLRDTGWGNSSDARVQRTVNALKAVQAASKGLLKPDRLENNDEASLSSGLPLGLTADLTIHAIGDRDFFRFEVEGRSQVTVALAYPSAIGRVFPVSGGILQKTGCGFGVLDQKATPTGVALTYTLPPGAYQLPLGSTTVVPYDVQFSRSAMGGALPPSDVYEPNNTYATRTNMREGKVATATLHSASDVDWFSFYSNGDFDTAFVSFASQIKVLKSDMPLSLRFFDSFGVFLGAANQDAACVTKPSFHVPAGYVTVEVTAASPGGYALWMGATATVHQVLELDRLVFTTFNENDPVDYLITQPHEWLEAFTNTDYRIAGFHLAGPNVHVTAFAEDGTKLAEGTPAAQVDGTATGEDILFVDELRQKRFVLKLDLAAPATGELPTTLAIPVRLTMQTGGL